MKRIRYVFAGLCLLSMAAQAQIRQTDVLVIGGGIGGTAAAIQSARMGAKTILVEEGPWLGGMLSAAGVSAIDGNHQLPSGIWGEFRSAIYKYYGGPDKVATGWVSNTQFEPHVADSILKRMAANEPALTVLHGYRLHQVVRSGSVVKGAVIRSLNSEASERIEARITIDATELGDVMAKAKVPYSLGMEAGSTTGENVGVNKTSNIVQDLTYVAILKDYGKGRDCTIAKPKGYTPAEFDGASLGYFKDTTRKRPTVSAQMMLDYGKLPNGKYMLNWPNYGNDTYLNIVESGYAKREAQLRKAKEMTLRFVYFIQQELGYKHLGLTDDEFPTADRLALMPYHREGRRVKGILRFTLNELARPFDFTWYRTGISVGDYPVDHHHKKNLKAPQQLDFYPVPSYNIPLGALIPATTEGLVIAEKGISVSNVINGTTRLQPVVLLTGQAAGTIAALSVRNQTSPRNLPVRQVQQALLASGAYIMPYNDVKPDHPDFLSIQRIGATGILKGKPTPHAWANQTWFYPDSLVKFDAFVKDLVEVYPQMTTPVASLSNELSIDALSRLLQIRLPGVNIPQEARKILGNVGVSTPLTRAQTARLLDKLLDPFSIPVDHQGKFTGN